MGLFDIFRRHKKKQEEQPESASPKSTQPSAPQEPASQATEEVPQQPAASEQPTEVVSASATEPAEEPASQSTTPELTASEAVESAAPQATTAPESAAQPTEAEVQSTESALTSASEQPTAPAESAVTPQSTEPAQSTAADADEATSAADSNAGEEEATEPTSEEAPASVAEEAVESTNEEDQTAKKYDQGLAKSRTGFGARLNRFLANFRHVDEDFFDDLEDMLIESDVGYDMAMKLSDELREEVKLENAKSKQDVSNVIIEKMVDLYDQAGKDENPDLNMAKSGPTVIMFVGVNGAGKTTTIGKMAALFKKQGKKVLLAAADTFRAGATEQLDVWAKRDGVDIVTGPENGDPAAVVFDAVQKAKNDDYDILFVDTAGRLQNKVNLMKELAKMKRILTREIPDAPHEVLLVLDATTGQNALNQAKLFKESTDVTGIVLTKLDGTARGGIVLAIRNELHLPVKYVGLGEKVDDLQKFNASDFVYGLFKGLVDVD